MKLSFYKYQGTGNDFVLVDNRQLKFPKNDTKLVEQLCNRKFGIGADGFILLENNDNFDFTMVYYNADGNLSSMCGNGGRCIVHFANYLGIINKSTTFEAIDGVHEATIENATVSLKMNDVSTITENDSYVFLDTGSPHHVQLVENVTQYDVFGEGRKIRNEVYGREGANVNFVTPLGNDIFSVRTYERGVEDETLSCGTGVTAVALAVYKKGLANSSQIQLNTPGGVLKVSFTKSEAGYSNIYLIGLATQVFEGVLNI
ncbi:diaminopimelate epimerase [Patiriisocius hiemis]|uniref:Diaminopimelate epimerase n=1 Tax=Patiriisocius hiemis TaxID=3075604 RepID=A0ABU2YAG5_9FLAO|nr:diaminopimelate epimerase [Constantimarinum sp. W242]MDT0555181.1 diaminopimelate epimerase [Constantimarinum sp. W242]